MERLTKPAPDEEEHERSSPVHENFCLTCGDLFRGRKDLGGEWDRETTFGKLKASAGGGCDQCQLIVDLILRFGIPQVDGAPSFTSLNDETVIECTAEEGDSERDGRVRGEIKRMGKDIIAMDETEVNPVVQRIGMRDFIFDFDPWEFGLQYVERPSLKPHLYCLPGKSAPWPEWTDLLIHNHLSGDTSSAMALDTARKWVTECEAFHRSCQAPKHTILPSRTIFVGTDNHQIRLSQNKEVLGQYTCLSHCWGSAGPLRTTKASIDNHLMGLDWTTLPKTFQEAIDFTRRLGVVHLWIDSLCIVQDDDQDWLKESNRMASIYANAYLTIAAAASKDSTEGLFRAQPETHPTTMEVASEDRLPRHVHAIRNLHSPRPGSIPWLERGWVLQERLLSPRLLQFHEYELAWECKSGRRCECDAHDVADHEVLNRSSWEQIVAAYSGLKLTMPKDKLPAISGIAQTFKAEQPALGSYHAGLWEKNFLHQLTWYSYHLEKPEAYRAPSWSWASNDGKISFANETYHRQLFEAKVLRVHCETSSANPYGEVFGGHVELQLPLFPAYVLSPEERVSARRLGRRDLKIPFGLGQAHFDDPLKPFGVWVPTPDLYCAVLRIGEKVRCRISFLLLEPDGRDENAWGRVGFANEEIGYDQLDELFGLFEEYTATIRVI